MKKINFFVKYSSLISLFFVSIFSNINYLYVYLNNYLLSYLYNKDSYFNIFFYKLIIPLNLLGFFLGGFSIYNFLNIFGYKKTIQISIFFIGLILILESYSYSCLVHCFFSFFNGYFLCIFYIFSNNLCYSLYPKKIKKFKNILWFGWTFSYITINYLSFFIINPNNKKLNFNINDSLKIFKEEMENFPFFMLVYGIFLIIQSILLNFTLKNPPGITSKFINYFELILLRKKKLSSKIPSNLKILKLKKYFLGFYKTNITLYKSKKNENKILESYLLNENNQKIKQNNKLDKKNKISYYRLLFPKNLIWILLMFNNTYIIFTFYIINFKIIGFKFYQEKQIIDLSLIIFLFYLLGKFLTEYWMQKIKLKLIFWLLNLIILFGILLRLIVKIPIINFLISLTLIFFGISILLNSLYLFFIKIYGRGFFSFFLNGITESMFFVGTFFEYFLEILKNEISIFNLELFLIIIILINFIILFYLKKLN